MPASGLLRHLSRGPSTLGKAERLQKGRGKGAKNRDIHTQHLSHLLLALLLFVVSTLTSLARSNYGSMSRVA